MNQKEEEMTTQLSVKVTSPQSDKLAEYAGKKGLTVEEVVKQAIDEHISRDARESKRSGIPKVIRTGQSGR
jgi:predicted metal-dependent peptidase